MDTVQFSRGDGVKFATASDDVGSQSSHSSDGRTCCFSHGCPCRRPSAGIPITTLPPPKILPMFGRGRGSGGPKQRRLVAKLRRDGNYYNNRPSPAPCVRVSAVYRGQSLRGRRSPAMLTVQFWGISFCLNFGRGSAVQGRARPSCIQVTGQHG